MTGSTWVITGFSFLKEANLPDMNGSIQVITKLMPLTKNFNSHSGK
ncbi:hypothetical protein BH10CYA1_BH10CYA1_60110 [soil metagenome]